MIRCSAARWCLPAATLGLLWVAGCRSPAKAGSPWEGSAGIESNGRIPKVELPADVPNPDRWRYLPEGRIPEGSMVDRFMQSSFAVPLLFFEGDVGAGGGVSLTDIDFRNQRRREFAAINLSYTTEGQQNYGILWRRWTHQHEIPTGGVIQEERSFLQASAGYSKTLTRRFYGIGPQALETDESSFTDEVSSVAFHRRQSFPDAGDDWVWNAGIAVESRELGRGFVSGVPSTNAAPKFAARFAEDDGLDSLWLSAGLRYDTRDSVHNPYRGFTLGVGVNGSPLMTGSRDGAIFGFDGRAFLPVPALFHEGGDGNEENPPTDVLAFVIQLEDTTGDLPFWALPSLGGSDRLRGFGANRWTDDAAWFAAIEHRIVVVPRGFGLYRDKRVERLGVALFYELGGVASSIDAIDLSEAESSYGFSLRLGLERAAMFRIDFGFSEEGSNTTILYGLSF